MNTSAETVTLDDISNDIEHLYHLLDTAVGLELGGGGKTGLKVSALIWVARDLAQKVSNQLLDNFVDPVPSSVRDEAE